jgi:hypothetical protein
LSFVLISDPPNIIIGISLSLYRFALHHLFFLKTIRKFSVLPALVRMPKEICKSQSEPPNNPPISPSPSPPKRLQKFQAKESGFGRHGKSR